MSSLMGVDVDTIRGDHMSEQKYGGEVCTTDGQPLPCDAIALLDVVDGLQAENARLQADLTATIAWAKDEQAKREAAEDARVQARSEAAYMERVVVAARGFAAWHLKGQPGTVGTLYPMTYAQLDDWHEEYDKRLSVLITAVDALDAASV